MMPYGRKIVVSVSLLLFMQVWGPAQIAANPGFLPQPRANRSVRPKASSPLDLAVHALFAVHRF